MADKAKTPVRKKPVAQAKAETKEEIEQPVEPPADPPGGSMSSPGVLAEELETETELQPAIEWQPEDVAFKCKCGRFIPTGVEMRTHLLRQGLKEPGMHESLGKYKPLTDELVELPDRKRKILGEDAPATKVAVTRATITTSPQAATSVTVVPKTLVIEYCPEFRSGMEAGIQLGWMPKDVTLQDFLRFCVLTVFADRDIALVSFVKLTKEVPGNGHGLGVQVPSRN